MVIVVVAVLVILAAQDDDEAGGGDTTRERREAAQEAEARADEASADQGGDADDGEPAGGVGAGGASDGRSAAQLLAVLVVRDEGSSAGYQREAFGEGWDIDAEGCDTREVVLAEESTAPVVRRDDCSVASGQWSSLYDGATTRDADELEIDHMVPLAEAWDSGAAAWTHERRELYANDLRRQGALVAVTAETNQSKSDSDPAEWMPPDRDAWCPYARAWIVQKHAWGLTVDPAEHDALEEVLAAC